MAKFILGVTFALSLLGFATTTSVSAEHIMNVPTFTMPTWKPRKKSNHHHLDVSRIIRNPLRYIEGWASYYGYEFAGRLTASGSRFNPEAFTCAMRWLPLNSWVKVQNLNNGRTISVKITDRGPFVAGRIIDLSIASRRALGMAGLAPVRVIY